MINLGELREKPYPRILCYPKPSKVELKARLKELEELGVKALEFCGDKEAFNTPVLGKGYVGIVVMAHSDFGRVALKIRRVDTGPRRIKHEAEMLRIANSVNVGPEFLGVSENFLLMQFIDGALIPKWLEHHEENTRTKVLLRDVLEQCWRLDKAGLDHGELSHAPKHILIDREDRPFIVDFEGASINRRPSNVTSICHFLFLSGLVAERVAKNLRVKDGKALIEALRSYKKNRNRGDFGRVLAACGL